MNVNSLECPFSVSQLNRYARDALEHAVAQVWVRGELTALSTPSSGHWYFTLKDETAQISCALFKYRVPSQTVAIGTEVLVCGLVTLYEPRGQYQMIVDQLLPWGLGQRHAQFEALKKKFYELGMLDAAQKKALPRFPMNIGIISSQHAAGFYDVLTILRKRFPIAKIHLYPTLVQGDAAIVEIIRAIDRVEKDVDTIDVVMIVRGGGAPEDLWCFNDERVAKRVFDMRLPVIVGIGHEIDTTLVDLIADVRAPTPTAAAQMVVPDQLDLFELLERFELQMKRSWMRSSERLWMRIDYIRSRWVQSKAYLSRKRQQIDRLKLAFAQCSNNFLRQYRYRLQKNALRLKDVMPYRPFQDRLQNFRYRLQIRSLERMGQLRLHLERQASRLMGRDPKRLLDEGRSFLEADDRDMNDIYDLHEGSRWRLWVKGGKAEILIEKQLIAEQ